MGRGDGMTQDPPLSVVSAEVTTHDRGTNLGAATQSPLPPEGQGCYRAQKARTVVTCGPSGPGDPGGPTSPFFP